MIVQGFRESDLTYSSNSKSGSKEYIVTNVLLSETEEDVLANAGIPAIGDSWSITNGSLKVDSIDTARAEQGAYAVYFVTVNYLEEYQDLGGGQTGSTDTAEDAILVPPSISFSAQQYEVALEKAYLPGDTQFAPSMYVVNTLGEPFNPAIGVLSTNTLIDLTYNVLTVNTNNIVNYTNTVNNGSITVAGFNIEQEKGRILNYGASSQVAGNGDPYWTVNVQIEVNPNGQKINPINSSFRFRETASSDARQILNKDLPGGDPTDDTPVTEPKPIAADDTILDTRRPDATTGKPAEDLVDLPFQAYYATSWSTLGLPS